MILMLSVTPDQVRSNLKTRDDFKALYTTKVKKENGVCIINA